MRVGLAIALLVLGLGQAPHRKGRAGMVQLSEESAGREITARVGERIELVLPETESTGYRWHVSGTCLELMATELDESRPPMTSRPGAPGEHRWVFLAKVAGRCELRLMSARSWETSGTERSVVFPITVVAR